MSHLFKTVALIGKYNSPEIGDSLLRLAGFRMGWMLLGKSVSFASSRI